MPSSVTHAYFAQDVYKKLKPSIKKKFNFDTMQVFAQGPDILFFDYMDINHGKKMRSFARTLHASDTKKFFTTYIDYILRYRLEKNEEVIASLYGQVLHAVLDAATHPLVYYKCGIYNKGNHNTLKYRAKHMEMELLIDLYMLEKRELILPKKIKLSKFLFPTTTISPMLVKLYDDIYSTVYHEAKVGSTYQKGLKKMALIYRYFRYDKHGIKLKLYRVIDQCSKKSPLVFQNLSYASDLREKAAYMNFEHNTWTHPCDEDKISTESFFDLYHHAMKKALSIIGFMNEILSGKKELRELDKVLFTHSYQTGFDSDIKKEMKYFEI